MSVMAKSRQEVGTQVVLSVHAVEPVHQRFRLWHTGWRTEGCDVWISSLGFPTSILWRYAVLLHELLHELLHKLLLQVVLSRSGMHAGPAEAFVGNTASDFADKVRHVDPS